MCHVGELALLALVLLGPATTFGLIAGWLFRRAGEAPRRAALLGAGVAVLALAATIVFGLDQLSYGLSENGPSYYPFSAYMRYREALHGVGATAALVVYAALSAALAVGAVLAHRKRRLVAIPLGLLALASPALPLAVAAGLPRSEYGKDAVLHLAAGSWPPVSESAPIAPCFEYSVQTPEYSGPGVREVPPTLCVELKLTPNARKLSNTDDEDRHATIYDVIEDLNRQGIKPYDRPTDLDLDGIEISHAWWQGKHPEPPRPPLSPRSPDEMTAEQLSQDQRAWSRSHDRRDVLGGWKDGCEQHASSSGALKPGPPAPTIRVIRHSFGLEIRYRFHSQPSSPYCRPDVVIGRLYAGHGDRLIVSETRVRVESARGILVLRYDTLRGQTPEWLEVHAVSLGKLSSRRVTRSVR